jgi:hypothetical protein
MHGLGIETGIDLAKLAGIGDWISSAINRPNGAKAGRALCARAPNEPSSSLPISSSRRLRSARGAKALDRSRNRRPAAQMSAGSSAT